MDFNEIDKAIKFSRFGNHKECIECIKLFEKDWKEGKFKPSEVDLINYYDLKIEYISMDEFKNKEEKVLKLLEYTSKGFSITSKRYSYFNERDVLMGDIALWFYLERERYKEQLKEIHFKSW